VLGLFEEEEIPAADAEGCRGRRVVDSAGATPASALRKYSVPPLPVANWSTPWSPRCG
jgi:hypothetical protein